MLENYIDDYIEYIENVKKLSRNTLLSYKRDLKKYKCYIESRGMDVRDMMEGSINMFLLELEEESSISSVSRMVSTIKSFHDFLFMKKISQTNPASNIRKPKLSEVQIDILTKEEIEMLLKAPDENSHIGIRDKAILEVLYGTGMKVSEIAELKLEDVNTDMEYVNFGHGRSKRIVPMNGYIKDCIEDYMEKGRNLLLKKGESEYLFLNQKGEHFTRQGLWKIIKKYTKAIDLKKNVTPMTLRHSFAIHLIENGADLKVVSQILGNLNISSLQVYMNCINRNLRDEFKRNNPRKKQ